jgi:hypothetical protein
VVLRDSHWIGGDPARGEVYGWSSWAPGRAVLAVRNPSGERRSFTFVLGRLLELPRGEPQVWVATSAFGKGRARVMHAHRTERISLAPYQVEVLDLLPGTTAAP